MSRSSDLARAGLAARVCERVRVAMAGKIPRLLQRGEALARVHDVRRHPARGELQVPRELRPSLLGLIQLERDQAERVMGEGAARVDAERLTVGGVRGGVAARVV